MLSITHHTRKQPSTGPQTTHGPQSATIKLSKDFTVKAAATIMVAQAAKIDQTTLEVPEQKCTSTTLDPSPAVKKVCLSLPDASKEVVIGANLDPK
jgi:hypothetical protein